MIDGGNLAVGLVLLILVPILITLIELHSNEKRLAAAEDLIAQLCGVKNPRDLLEADLPEEEVK